jgi:pSer/pThr/pTyr-binding forkhead associated (FHA) protein
MAKFIVFYNGEQLKTFDIDEPVITIGRLPENTISIANMGVSRRHVRIEEDADRVLILNDLNSLNGTYVNGKKVKKQPLADGDKISIGKYVIIFRKADSVLDQPEGMNISGTQNEPALTDDTGESSAVESDDDSLPDSAIDAGGHAVLIETDKHVVYKLDKTYLTMGCGETDDIFISGFLIGKGQISIEKKDDGFYICASKVIGKLKVNGHSVKNHQLKHKDRIEIGGNTFRYMENG